MRDDRLEAYPTEYFGLKRFKTQQIVLLIQPLLNHVRDVVDLNSLLL